MCNLYLNLLGMNNKWCNDQTGAQTIAHTKMNSAECLLAVLSHARLVHSFHCPFHPDVNHVRNDTILSSPFSVLETTEKDPENEASLQQVCYVKCINMTFLSSPETQSVQCTTLPLQLLTVVDSLTQTMVWWIFLREQLTTLWPPTAVTVRILWMEVWHVPARQMELGLGVPLAVVGLITNYLHPGRTHNLCTAAVLHQ